MEGKGDDVLSEEGHGLSFKNDDKREQGREGPKEEAVEPGRVLEERTESHTFAGFLFDLDGTIIDTTDAVTKHWEKLVCCTPLLEELFPPDLRGVLFKQQLMN